MQFYWYLSEFSISLSFDLGLGTFSSLSFISADNGSEISDSIELFGGGGAYRSSCSTLLSQISSTDSGADNEYDGDGSGFTQLCDRNWVTFLYSICIIQQHNDLGLLIVGLNHDHLQL